MHVHNLLYHTHGDYTEVVAVVVLEKESIWFVQGVWADPVSKDVAQVFQAWAVLEARHGTVQLARELYKCAVKADPQSETSWAV